MNDSASVLLSRKELSQILKRQMDTYNKEHPDNQIDTELLFSRLMFYYLHEHPERYTCLGQNFDKDFNPNADYLKKLYKKADEADKPRDEISGEDELFEAEPISDLSDFNDSEFNEGKLRPPKKKNSSPQKTGEEIDKALVFEEDAYCEAYLNGQYYIYGLDSGKAYEKALDLQLNAEELEDYLNGVYVVISKPSKLFYALARILHMDEASLMEAFFIGDGLNLQFYRQQYVKDIVDYYFHMTWSSRTKLVNALKADGHREGFSDATIYNILYTEKEIRFEEFSVLAPYLKIPDDLANACKHRLAQFYDAFSFNAGYNAFWEDYNDHPEEMGEAYGFVPTADYNDLESDYREAFLELEAYKDLLKETDKTMLYKLYESIGYSFSPIMDDIHIIPDNPSEEELLAATSFWVTFPDGRIQKIPAMEIKELLNKLSDYANYLMWQKFPHQEFMDTEKKTLAKSDNSEFPETEDDPADTNPEYIDPDTLIY